MRDPVSTNFAQVEVFDVHSAEIQGSRNFKSKFTLCPCEEIVAGFDRATELETITKVKQHRAREGAGWMTVQ